MNTEKLCIGTAQFGLAYGIANKNGQVPIKAVQSILEYSKLSGVNTLDTAVLYGESQRVLGEAGVSDWHVVSKLPESPEVCNDIEEFVSKNLFNSLQTLKIDSLYGLLLHRPAGLFRYYGDKYYKTLIKLKSEGLVKKIGISVIQVTDLDELIKNFDFDIVQVAMNIIDRRLLNSGWMDKLSHKGVEIHIRSAFLQGLLLMDYHDRPEKFKKWNSLWNHFQLWLKEVNLTPLQACLGFLDQFQSVNKVIIGVDNLDQLKEILIASKRNAIKVPDEIQSDDLELINPFRWESL